MFSFFISHRNVNLLVIKKDFIQSNHGQKKTLNLKKEKV